MERAGPLGPEWPAHRNLTAAYGGPRRGQASPPGAAHAIHVLSPNEGHGPLACRLHRPHALAVTPRPPSLPYGGAARLDKAANRRLHYGVMWWLPRKSGTLHWGWSAAIALALWGHICAMPLNAHAEVTPTHAAPRDVGDESERGPHLDSCEAVPSNPPGDELITGHGGPADPLAWTPSDPLLPSNPIAASIERPPRYLLHSILLI